MNRQAILIIAHNNIWFLKNLLKSLDSKYFDIFVHIDAKSNMNENDFMEICKYSDVYIYKEIDVRWGEYSLIECEMLLLKNALKCNRYSYFHLISGADLPIKSNKDTYYFFEKSQKEFIHFESAKLPSNKYSYYHKYNFNMKNYKKNVFNKMLNKILITIQYIIFIKMNRNVDFYTGSQWFSITYDCASFIVSKEIEIQKRYRYSKCGDESFVQTTIYNSKFKNNLFSCKYDDDYNSCKRIIDWKRGKPYTFRITDYDSIISSNCFFARKFDEHIDKEIIKKIIKHRSEIDEKRE